MPRPRKRITAQQAAKILGVTPENLRLLAKGGILSSVVVDTGSKHTRYYFADEVQRRKAASREYLSHALPAAEALSRARSLNEEAEREEAAARQRYKDSVNWKARQLRLSDLLVAIVQAYDHSLSQREIEVLTDIATLKSYEQITERFGITTTRLADIIAKAIKKIVRAKGTLDQNAELFRENQRLANENAALVKQNEYLSTRNATVVPDGSILVLSEKDYAIRRILVQEIDRLGYNYMEEIRLLREAGINTFADLVVTSEEQLRQAGLSRSLFGHRFGLLGLRFDMNLAQYGLGSDPHYTRLVDNLKRDYSDNPEKALIRKKLLTPIVEYGVSVRAFNCLKAADIHTLADLCQYHRTEIAKIRNLGRKSLNELLILLEKLGLSFGMDVTFYGIVPSKKYNE